jgi:serine/threonine-protein kinase HipA
MALEMRTTLMATACIEMMESRLMEENGRAHFMTKAF